MADPRMTVQVGADDTNLGATLERSREDIKKFSEQAKAHASNMAKAWENAVPRIAQSLALFSGAMTGAMGKIALDGAKFEATMRNVNIAAKLPEAGLKALEDRVLSMSRSLQVGKGPQEMAAALYDIYGAGFQGAKAMNILEVSTKSASAGLTDTTTASKALMTVMEAYKLKAEDAATVGDIMFRTVDKGRLSYQELAQSIGPAATKAASFGVSLEEVGAAMAILSRTMPASEASTALEKIMTQLAAPTKEAADDLAAYGIQTGRAALEQKGLVGVIQQVVTATHGNDSALRRMLSSSEALTASLALFSGGAGKDYLGILEANRHAPGALSDATAQQMKSTVKQWEVLKTEAEVGAISMRNSLLPVAGAVIQKTTELVRAFNDLSPATKALGVSAALAVTGIAGIASAGLLLAPQIAVIGKFVVSSGGLAAAARVMATGFGVMAVEVAALALPLVAIGAVTAGLVVAWQRDFGGIREITSNILGEVQDKTKTFLSAMSTGWKELSPAVLGVVDDVKAGLTDVGGVALEGFRFVSDTAKTFAADFRSIFGDDWFANFMEGFRTTFVGGVKLGIYGLTSAFDFARGTLKTLAAVAKGAFEGVSAFAGTMVQGVSALISGDWSSAWAVFISAIENVVPRIKAIMVRMVDEIKFGITESANHLTQKADELLYGASDQSNLLVSPATRQIRSIKQGTAGAINSGEAMVNKWMSDLLSKVPAAKGTDTRLKGTAYDPSFDPPDKEAKAKKGPSAEDLARARIVQEALAKVGTPLGQIPRFDAAEIAYVNRETANKCADTVRAINQAAGIKLGVATPQNAVDGAAIQRLGQGIGPDHADSIPGRLIPASQVKKGDQVLFKDTDPRYAGTGAATHIGVVIDPIKGIMVDASSASGKVVRRNFSEFGGDKLLGFLRPAALEGLSKDKTGGSGVENYAALAKTVQESRQKWAEFVGDDFEKQVVELQKKAEEALAGARNPAEVQAVKDKLTASIGNLQTQQTQELQGGNNTDQFDAESIEQHQRAYDQKLAMAANLDQFTHEQIAQRRALELAANQERIAQIQDELAHYVLSEEQKDQLRDVEAQAYANIKAIKQTERDDERAWYESDLEFKRNMDLITEQQYIDGKLRELEMFQLTEEQKRAILLETHQLQTAGANEFASGLENSFSQFLVQTMSAQQSFTQTFQSLWKSVMGAIVAEIAKAIVKALALKVIMNSIFGFFGGIFGLGGAVAENAAHTTGALGFAADTFGHHSGGVVGRDGSRWTRYHGGGIVGQAGRIGILPRMASDEVNTILQTGEQVLSRKEVAAARQEEQQGRGRGRGDTYIEQIYSPYSNPREVASHIGRDIDWRDRGL